MQELINYKKELKQFQLEQKKKIKSLQVEINELEKIGFNKLIFLHDLSVERKYPELAEEFFLLWGASQDLKRKLYDFIEEFDLESFCHGILDAAIKHYANQQDIIIAMDNDKIINYIDLERLLFTFCCVDLSHEDICKIFGMVANFDAKYLKRNKRVDKKNKISTFLIGKYFNEDGSFKLNTYVAEFKLYLLDIINKPINDFKTALEDCDLNDLENFSEIELNAETQLNEIVDKFVSLLEESNKKIKSEIFVRKQEPKKVIPDELKRLSREDHEELKKYYKNGKIIKLPDNIEKFNKLLDECGIDEPEKRYVLGLINKELKEINENKIMKFLDDNNKKVYQEANQIAAKINTSNPNYYLLIQTLDELKTAGEMLETTTDIEEKEYLFVEVASLISILKGINENFLEIKETNNKMIFLCNELEVPYLKQDSENLDGSFSKMIYSGIKKIRKENQGNYKLVKTNEKIPYRMYYIPSSKINVFFIEIDEGIYLTLGTNVVGEGFDEITNRVIYNLSTIKKLEKMIKDESTRNDILSDNEVYIELFNPENDLVVSRKRKSKKDN